MKPRKVEMSESEEWLGGRLEKRLGGGGDGGRRRGWGEGGEEGGGGGGEEGRGVWLRKRQGRSGGWDGGRRIEAQVRREIVKNLGRRGRGSRR